VYNEDFKKNSITEQDPQTPKPQNPKTPLSKIVNSLNLNMISRNATSYSAKPL